MAVIRQGPGPESRFSLISHEVSRNPEISLRTKGVYIYLRSHSEGWSMSVERIAKALGVSSDTVSAAVKELEKYRLLSRSQTVLENGRYGPSEYAVMAEPLPKIPVTEKPGDGSAGDGETGQRKSRALKKTNLKKTTKEENQTPIVPDGDEVVADRFDEFWDTYDHKKNRGGAERAWKKATKATDPQEIINAAKVFVSSQRSLGKHPQYTPYPPTWLNGKRWLDEVDPPDDVGGFGYEISFDD